MLNDDCLSILSVVQVCLYLSGKLDFGSDDFESDLYLLFPVEVVVLLVNKVPFHSASILHRLFLLWAFLDFRLFFLTLKLVVFYLLVVLVLSTILTIFLG